VSFSFISMCVVLPCFLVGFFWAASSRTCLMVRTLPPSALPIVKAGLVFSSSVFGYRWYASTVTFSGCVRRHLMMYLKGITSPVWV